MMDGSIFVVKARRARATVCPVGRRAADEVLDSFSAVARSLRAAAAQTYATFGVGSAQAKLLRHIGGGSGTSQADLARATGSDPTLTGRVLGTLIARGWVRRRRSEDDRRQYALELSAAGKRARARVEAARRQIARRMVAALDQTDIRDFERIARKLRAAFEAPK
jgi:DNA-binding MarR family transcriptional regulator